MKSQLTSAQTTTTTSADDSFALNQLEELYETINILASGIQALNEDTERVNRELIIHQTQLQSLIENISQMKVAVEEEHGLVEGNRQN